MFAGSRHDPLEGSGDFCINSTFMNINTYNRSAASDFCPVEDRMTKEHFRDLERRKLLSNAQVRGT